MDGAKAEASIDISSKKDHKLLIEVPAISSGQTPHPYRSVRRAACLHEADFHLEFLSLILACQVRNFLA